MRNKKEKGFSLIELLIYIGIFVASSVFLVSILIIFTRIHLQQTSINTVNQQISFVNNTVQRLVRQSSLIDIPAGVSTSSLTLRMASSSKDKTSIYLDSDENVIYMTQGTSTPVALTDTNVEVEDFSISKYENPGGHDTVQMYMTMNYDTENPRSEFRRTIRTAVSRVSAATFDSSILPNADGSFDIGNSTQKWRDGYFSGNVGIGIAPAAGAGLKLDSDIAISDSSNGLVLTSPDGSCFRLTINNTGNIATSSISCP